MDHKDLDAWKQAMDLVEDIYRVTRKLSSEERYGLAAQLQRAAVSIPSNISQGSARRSSKEFLNFLSISLGSAAEVETQLLIIKRLGYDDVDQCLNQVSRVRALILGLRNRLRGKVTT